MATNKLSMPEIRERLRELAAQYGIDELNDLADQTFRKPAKKRAPTRSLKLTPELAVEIRQYAVDNPTAHQQDIAEHFQMNHGRVSEALDNQI